MTVVFGECKIWLVVLVWSIDSSFDGGAIDNPMGSEATAINIAKKNWIFPILTLK